MNERQTRFGDRMYGLVTTVFFGGIALAIISSGKMNGIEKSIAGSIGIFGTAEGVGDLFSGNHHYLSSKAIGYFKERRNIRYLL